MFSVSQAARTASVGKSTIGRWIADGRLSANRTEDGRFLIDPAELARVMAARAAERPGPDTTAHHGTPSQADGTTVPQHSAEAFEVARLRAELEAAMQLLAAERERARELRETADRLLGVVERLSLPAPVPTPVQAPAAIEPVEPRRGLLGRLFG